MKKRTPFFAILLIFLVFLGQSHAHAEASKYVNITIEVQGLEESAKTLNKVTQELTQRFAEMNPDTEKMTPEQLKELAKVIEKTNQLAMTINSATAQTGSTIQNLREPTKVLVSEAMTSAYQSSVDPTIQSVNKIVSKWLNIIIFGLLLIIALAGFYIYIATKKIRDAVGVLKSITDEYEIVPRKLKEESVEIES